MADYLITNGDLKALLVNGLSLAAPFLNVQSKKIWAVRNYQTKEESFQLLESDQIPCENLPEPDEYLDAETGEWAEYIEKLNFEIKSSTQIADTAVFPFFAEKTLGVSRNMDGYGAGVFCQKGDCVGMLGKVNYVEFPKFDFFSQAVAQTKLNCSYGFKAQSQNNKSIPIKAVLVTFDASSEDGSVRFSAQCRVIFEFSDETEVPDDNALLAENRDIAYREFCNRANDVFKLLGQGGFPFQNIQ